MTRSHRLPRFARCRYGRGAFAREPGQHNAAFSLTRYSFPAGCRCRQYSASTDVISTPDRVRSVGFLPMRCRQYSDVITVPISTRSHLGGAPPMTPRATEPPTAACSSSLVGRHSQMKSQHDSHRPRRRRPCRCLRRWRLVVVRHSLRRYGGLGQRYAELSPATHPNTQQYIGARCTTGARQWQAEAVGDAALEQIHRRPAATS